MIEEDVGRSGDNFRLLNPGHVSIVKEVPHPIRRVPAVSRVVPAHQPDSMVIANGIQIVYMLVVHGSVIGVVALTISHSIVSTRGIVEREP